MCHARTDVSSEEINGEIRPYRHPARKGLSEWTKAESPSGSELSHCYSLRVCVLMDADLAAVLGRQTVPVYTSEFTKVTSCRGMYVRDMKLADGALADRVVRGEGQNNVMRRSMNLTHLYLSNCLFPV